MTITLPRASVTVPLLREDVALGVIELGRDATQPYTAREIAMVETFAHQAVIAIENARLFAELQQRTNDLSHTLEQQTALGEVLRVIATLPDRPASACSWRSWSVPLGSVVARTRSWSFAKAITCGFAAMLGRRRRVTW